jgi:uncharacterized protein (TIGR02996 family)
VASLLVYLDPVRVYRLLPQRLRGAAWTIPARDLADEIELLDDGSSLFVVTLDAGSAVLVAYLEAARRGEVLGTATVCDADITHLLPRLGCARAEDLPGWADLPRVLPPGDVDLLLTRPPPVEAVTLPPLPPVPQLRVVASDPTAARLLAAIYDDLASDEARLVYADYLQDRGDPRGELIALQLANPAGPPSQRERELIAACGPASLGAIAPHVQSTYVLRRGFLAACATTYEAIPAEIANDIAWSTVEELHTISLELLRSPALVSATRVGVDGLLLASAAHSDRELPCEVATGRGRPFGPQIDGLGMAFPLETRNALGPVGALTRLRAASFNGVELTRMHATALLNSPLGKQLRHLDLNLGPGPLPDIGDWRRLFENSALHRLTLRTTLETRRQPRPGEVIGPWISELQNGPWVCIALERMAGPHRLVVQVDRALLDPHVTQCVRLIAPLGRRIDRIEVQDLASPDRVGSRQQRLIAALAPMFARVVPSVGPLLAP